MNIGDFFIGWAIFDALSAHPFFALSMIIGGCVIGAVATPIEVRAYRRRNRGHFPRPHLGHGAFLATTILVLMPVAGFVLYWFG